HEGGHRSDAHRHRLLHELSALAYKSHGHGERKRAGDDEGRVLPEAVTGGEVGREPLFGEGGGGGDAGGGGGGLRGGRERRASPNPEGLRSRAVRAGSRAPRQPRARRRPRPPRSARAPGPCQPPGSPAPGRETPFSSITTGAGPRPT